MEKSPGNANAIDLIIDAGDSANRLVRIAKSLSYGVQEDASRVTYPSCCEVPSFRCINCAELEEDEISDGVHRVFCKTDGVLLEFYNGGSLEQIFKEDLMKKYDWQRWPSQIGTSLNYIHEAGRTHMDFKPANIVLVAQGNAVLIDISGIGGITHSWQAAEIRRDGSPFDLGFEVRVLHDTWAYGKLLSDMAALAGKSTFTEALLCVEGVTWKRILGVG